MTSYSSFYGRRPRANQFPGYTTEDLQRDLCSPSLDAETRARIEAEISRREQAADPFHGMIFPRIAMREGGL